MNQQENPKVVREYRTIKRRKIKALIGDLKKKTEELFKLWAYEKALDEKTLRQGARENLIELEKLEYAYDRAAHENPSPEEFQAFFTDRTRLSRR